MIAPWERTLSVLCYLAAMRVPVVALWLPDWAFTVPSGLLIAGFAWAYGRRRSPFLRHHGQEGFKWALLSNLLLAAVALLSKGLFLLWFYSGLAAFNSLWHLSAGAFRWAGLLMSVLTVVVMVKAFRGETGDAFSVHRTSAH